MVNTNEYAFAHIMKYDVSVLLNYPIIAHSGVPFDPLKFFFIFFKKKNQKQKFLLWPKGRHTE